MSPNKRKIFASDTSDEDGSFKHCSSLRVNLSYCESLSDSGNGSLWRTDIENDERKMNGVRTIKRLSRDEGTYKKNLRSDSDNKDMPAESTTKKLIINNDSKMSVSTKGIQLKRLTVNLEDINVKERCLETSCKRLKDAILCKTKQIFDRENELSVKTAMVLGNRENHFASSTHNSNIRNKTVMLDITDHHLKKAAEKYTDTSSNQLKEDPNIVVTPAKSDKRRKSLEKTINKSRLTQRRLFVEKDKQVERQMKCRIIGDVVLKENLPLSSLRQANRSGSPILSGSNRRLSLFRARSKLRSQNSFENLNNTSTIHSVQNIDIGMPVGCSTFIENSAMADKEINDDVDAFHAMCTTNKVISMEMTEVYGGIRTSKEHASLQNRNLDANHCSKNSKEEKFKEDSKKTVMEQNKNISSLEDVEHPINKITMQNDPAYFNLSRTNDVNDQDIVSVHIDTVIPMQISTEDAAAVTKTHNVLQAHECDSKTKCQNQRCCISLSNSNDTIRSSLNVNTSLDVVTETGKTRNIWEPSIHHRANDANQDFEGIINNKELIALNDQRESANTIRTSLQMNTSKDSVCKTWRKRSDKDNETRNHSSTNTECSAITENKKSNDIDSLENISLIGRLRNISMRNQVSRNDKSRVSKIREEDKRHSSNSGDSYVEGTPYPISRSVLFKSQLKYKTHLDYADYATCSSNLNSMDNEEKNEKTKSIALNSKVLNEMHISSGIQKTIETNTVTLESTPSCNPFITQNQLTVIEDMPDVTKSETAEKNRTVQNTECVPVRKNRRRLLPINENSQLCSISPVEEGKYTPEESTSAKRNKRLKRKLPKRKLMRSKNNTSNIKQDITSNRMWSDSDCDISGNKKKEKKKTRKPKKIISKKIFIKKFADENVLNVLEGNRQNKEDQLVENGDSLDDFVKCRTISSQWNKYKSQKIVIVTTGLSKGDKSLVKSIIKSLGAAEMELNVSRRTTHVVSTGVRTVNLLRGIIRGCWLVTLEWVLKSLENNTWLDPETFEMKHFSKAVQENRKDRQLFGFSYIPELFTACGLIYVERKTTVPYDTLKELIKTAGGHITENIKIAKIIIGTNGLKETWVIDSITTGELQLTKLYQRK